MATSMTRRRRSASNRRSSDRRRIFYDREGRPFRRAYLRQGNTRRASPRKTPRKRTVTRRRATARRDANGRFVKRRVRSAPRRRARPRPAPVERERRVRSVPTTSIVREASRRSVAGPALVKRRWWRVDGPVDPSLPDGYAYER